MADINSAIKFLRTEFPSAEISCINSTPLARDGKRLYGILFSEPGDAHAGDPVWARGPVAIVNFPTGEKDSRNFEIFRWLT